MKRAVLTAQIFMQVLAQMVPVGAGEAYGYGRVGTELPTDTGVQQDCTSRSREARADRLSKALRAGFGVQYWGDGYSAEALSRQSHGLLVIEAAKVGALFSESGREDFFTAEEIDTINRAGARPVLAYLNVSKIEDYRDYWVDLARSSDIGPPSRLPEWIGPREGHGQILAAYWTEGWQDILFQRVDMLMAQGFDGLFLDDVLQYYSQAFDPNLVWPGAGKPDGPDSAAAFAMEMMQLVAELAARARSWNCEALIIVNNGAFIGRDALGGQPADEPFSLFNNYVSSIDGILVENVLSDAAHPHTLEALAEDFRANQVPVLSLEFTTEFPGSTLENVRDGISARARNLGFTPYVAEDHLFDRLYPAIVTHPETLLIP